MQMNGRMTRLIFRASPPRQMGLLIFFASLLLAWLIAQSVLAGTVVAVLRSLAWIAGLVAVIVAVLRWRLGLLLLMAWLTLEDLPRKYGGNDMQVFVAKYILGLAVYAGFVLDRRRRPHTSWRPAFLWPLLAFFALALVQAFNPRSPSPVSDAELFLRTSGAGGLRVRPERRRSAPPAAAAVHHGRRDRRSRHHPGQRLADVFESPDARSRAAVTRTPGPVHSRASQDHPGTAIRLCQPGPLHELRGADADAASGGSGDQCIRAPTQPRTLRPAGAARRRHLCWRLQGYADLQPADPARDERRAAVGHAQPTLAGPARRTDAPPRSGCAVSGPGRTGLSVPKSDAAVDELLL